MERRKGPKETRNLWKSVLHICHTVLLHPAGDHGHNAHADEVLHCRRASRRIDDLQMPPGAGWTRFNPAIPLTSEARLSIRDVRTSMAARNFESSLLGCLADGSTRVAHSTSSLRVAGLFCRTACRTGPCLKPAMMMSIRSRSDRSRSLARFWTWSTNSRTDCTLFHKARLFSHMFRLSGP